MQAVAVQYARAGSKQFGGKLEVSAPGPLVYCRVVTQHAVTLNEATHRPDQTLVSESRGLGMGLRPRQVVELVPVIACGVVHMHERCLHTLLCQRVALVMPDLAADRIDLPIKNRCGEMIAWLWERRTVTEVLPPGSRAVEVVHQMSVNIAAGVWVESAKHMNVPVYQRGTAAGERHRQLGAVAPGVGFEIQDHDLICYATGVITDAAANQPGFVADHDCAVVGKCSRKPGCVCCLRYGLPKACGHIKAFDRVLNVDFGIKAIQMEDVPTVFDQGALGARVR